ncbi:MAG: class I SAM-dependent methyltransferase [Rhizobiaceae bacterium]
MTISKRERASPDLDAQRHYSSYEDWKGWDEYFTYSSDENEYYKGEMLGLELSGKNVLEIGFGSGSFLAWAKDAGASIKGTEINDRSLAEAKRFGVELLIADFENVASKHKECFDVIVAFDVFEHFTMDEIITRTKAAETMLRPGGYLVLRFPNGQSPLGLAPQNGDITHKEALSKEKIEQASLGTSFETTRYGGSFQILGPMGLKWIVRRLRYFTQSLLGGLLNAIYARKAPWDAVVVLVMRKTGQSKK